MDSATLSDDFLPTRTFLQTHTNALIVNSCWNGCLTNLNVPSIYQLFALLRCANCWSVARMMWRFPCFLISAFKKPSGIWSW